MDKRKMIFIGIIEDKRYSKILEFVKKIFSNFDYKLIFSNKKGNIIGLEKDLTLYIFVNMDPKDIDFYRLIGIEFNVLVHNFMKEEYYKEGLLTEQFTLCEYYILNSDDKNWTLLPLGSLDGVAVTYGFNSKSTLTISSYNINQVIRATLCLQRGLVSMFDRKIEPFEFTIEISSKNKDDIYPALAVSMLNLILIGKDDDIRSYKNIKI